MINETCIQMELNCKYKETAIANDFVAGMREGICPDAGYALDTVTFTRSVYDYGNVTFSKFAKAAVAEVHCSLYVQMGDYNLCTQMDLECRSCSAAQEKWSTAKYGTCASVGFSVKGHNYTDCYSGIGNVTFIDYTKSPVGAENCSLYTTEAQSDYCSQFDFDCTKTPDALEVFPSAGIGSCTAIGYSVKGTSWTDNLSGIGHVTTTTYWKPDVAVMPRNVCVLHDVVVPNHLCEEMEFNCTKADIATRSSDFHDGSCASVGYTVKGRSLTGSLPEVGEVTTTDYMMADLAGNHAPPTIVV